MEKLLHLRLSDLFLRAFGPLEETSRFLPERKTVIDGVPVRADQYSWKLVSGIFTLRLERAVSAGSFLHPGMETTSCTLDGEEIPPFTVSSVHGLLRDTGWNISPDDSVSEENGGRTIRRTERGEADWRRNLRLFGAESASVELSFIPGGEGSYSLRLRVTAPLPIDSDRELSVRLGSMDWRPGEEPGSSFRGLIIAALTGWNPYLDALGLERCSVTDYYRLLEAIVGHGDRERFSLVIGKGRDRSVRSDRTETTPDCYEWWREGFTDSPEEREHFMAWLDRETESGDMMEEALRAFGLSPGCTADDVRSAWRRKVRAFHPDVIGSKGLDPAFLSFAERETERLNALYRHLMENIR